MTNDDINQVIETCGLSDHVERHEDPPVFMWTLRVQGVPVLIQTQESANRMRIVAFVAQAEDVPPDGIVLAMEANYHSALDARYAITDDWLVAAFLHPFKELDGNQFVMGLYQTVHCAITFGDSYSGGTMVFGSTGDESESGDMESNAVDYLSTLVRWIREE